MNLRVVRSILPIVSVAILVTLAVPPAVAARPPKLMPDLRTLEPSGFFIEWDGPDKLLRFNNDVGNAGLGPLELFPVDGDCDGDGNPTNDRFAYQQIYRDANTSGQFERGVDRPIKPRLAGCFEFHIEHNHWHFEDFAKYQLKRMSDGKVVKATDKTSFCIIDTARRFPEIPGSPTHPYYSSCGATATTGLSVGWSDVYTAFLPGQELVITTQPDGQYCFISTSDPSGLLAEADDGNNVATFLLEITGDDVEELGTPC